MPPKHRGLTRTDALGARSRCLPRALLGGGGEGNAAMIPFQGIIWGLRREGSVGFHRGFGEVKTQWAGNFQRVHHVGSRQYL